MKIPKRDRLRACAAQCAGRALGGGGAHDGRRELRARTVTRGVDLDGGVTGGQQTGFEGGAELREAG